MFLAYMDDSGSSSPGDKKSPFQIVGCIIVPDVRFRDIETIAGIGLDANVPDDKFDEFTEKFIEFKGTDLYWGHDVWTSVPQENRFKTIHHLLRVVARLELPVIYGAVDKKKLEDTNYSSANPLDIAFKLCARGIEKWMQEKPPEKIFACLLQTITKTGM